MDCTRETKKYAVQDITLFALQEIGDVAFEKYTSGEIGQKELETIYLTLRQWSAMRDEIINLLDTYTDRLNNANEGNFYTEYT